MKEESGIDRNSAIERLLKNPQLMLLVIPNHGFSGIEKIWITVDKVDLTQHEIDFFRRCSFDSAEHDDIFDCKHCGHHVAIFEDICPNCNGFPHPAEELAA